MPTMSTGQSVQRIARLNLIEIPCLFELEPIRRQEFDMLPDLAEAQWHETDFRPRWWCAPDDPLCQK